jgi:signal transduction histidine kinase
LDRGFLLFLLDTADEEGELVMHVQETWPFLLPGVLIQLVMQGRYIAVSLKEKSKEPLVTALKVAFIVIFGLAGVAVHLFRAERTLPKDLTASEVERATAQTGQGIFLLLLLAYQVMGLHMLVENVENEQYVTLLTLLTVSFLVMLVHNLLPPVRGRFTGTLLPVLQLMLCVPIQYIDISGDNLFLSIIAGFSAINYTSILHAKSFGVGAYGAYLLGSIAKLTLSPPQDDMGNLVRYLIVNSLVVSLALIAFYTLKKQIITSVQLECALNTVQEQSQRLQHLALVEERNRMASEMHDTVGHTLTAAVLTLEQAESLVSHPQAVQRLRQGKEQVRRGLSELRTSIRTIRTEARTKFTLALDQLLDEIHLDTGLHFHVIAESNVCLSPLQAGILLSAIKECTTNAIRHGKATHIDLLMGEHQGQVRLSLTDNGVGSSKVQYGSGLSIMEERVQSVGGRVEIETAPGDGFTVSLVIPISRNEEAAQ